MNTMNRFYHCRRHFSLLLLLILTLAFCTFCSCASAENGHSAADSDWAQLQARAEPGQITEPYAYPADWNQASERWKRVANCQIDAEILNAMTTPALLETVLNYPFMADYCAYDDRDEGFAHVAAEFPAFRILQAREDVWVCLNAYLEAHAEDASVQTVYAQDILDFFEAEAGA